MSVFNNPELSYRIFMNLTPENVLDNSKLGGIFKDIKHDEYFWQQYCNINYFVFEKHETDSWEEIALYCYIILLTLFAKNKFPSFRFLQACILKRKSDELMDTTFFNVLDKKRIYSIKGLLKDMKMYDRYRVSKNLPIISDDSISNQSIYAMYDLDKLWENIDTTISLDQTFPQFDIDDPSIDHFSVTQLQLINKILKLTKSSCIYFIPSDDDEYSHFQHYTINYDVDINDYFRSYDQLSTILNNNNKINTLKYFSNIMN